MDRWYKSRNDPTHHAATQNDLTFVTGRIFHILCTSKGKFLFLLTHLPPNSGLYRY
jgi:hypothetical protein